ncbi:amino acid racemase [uncultured Draconibacterium sp.]|uniref:amino acid racemase n=1 Tax=uncultured Draconibacterium sp. TaxID=1573823 RepID=UPI0029C6A3A7|nr:amino acid racemase [uncultured Draconibacterium sp.]
MKKIGIIGGLGPEATIDYYKEIINYFNLKNDTGKKVYPEVVIYSVDMWKFVGYLGDNENEKAVNYIVERIKSLEKAGVDFAVLSANTPHLLFNEIQQKVSISLISIVEATARKAKSLGIKKCGLIGTQFTMKNDFYQKVFQQYNMEIVVPNPEQIEYINDKVFNEIELGIFKDDTKNGFLDILSEMKQQQGIEAVILGCTEFPLMFTKESYLELPFLNTTKIHVEAILKESLGGD